MTHILRIGVQIWPDDPFWVQVGEAIRDHAQRLAVDTVMVDVDLFARDDQVTVVEEILAHDLDALIGWHLDDDMALYVLEANVPIVHLGESTIQHPRFVAPHGLYAIARSLGTFVAERIAGSGTVLVVGGDAGPGEGGRSRLAGFRDAFSAYPAIRLHSRACPWRYERALPELLVAMRALGEQLHAICGLSDSLALAARDAGRELGLVDDRTVIVGINGDPLALVAIAEGSMTATMQTAATHLGSQALELAVCAAQGTPLPERFNYQPQLVTAENVTEIAMQQLKALAVLPSRLVGFNRQHEQQRLVHLETSLAINRGVGLVLDRHRLAHTISELIRTNYGYDEVQLFRWNAEEHVLRLEYPEQQAAQSPEIPWDAAPLLRAALQQNTPIFIPDALHSHRFGPDVHHPATRTRVVVPMHLGSRVTALLDLHSYRVTPHSQHDLTGLQTLADQLGIALRHAELYDEAVEAQARAQKADHVKTRLLANVSHELRTPLNVILGISQTALDALTSSAALPAAELSQDLRQIAVSGQHLLRLINDLLDLARAETDALAIVPETIETRPFLEETFRSMADHMLGSAAVEWRLALPAALPPIVADPVRLRQILLNLLHNATKFTERGQIVLGAEVGHELHLWIKDTGSGIPREHHAAVFQPFTSRAVPGRPSEGLGLGLSITQQLVELHGGRMSVESEVGSGSTFHIYLPLAAPATAPAPPDAAGQRVLLLLSEAASPPIVLVELAERRSLALHLLRPSDNVTANLRSVRPVLLVWDLATAAVSGGAVIEQLQTHPRIRDVPLLLYHAGQDNILAPSDATTGLLHKPTPDTTLIEALHGLDLRGPDGSILIVDDDLETRALHRRLIAAQFPTYAIDAVGNGREALAALNHAIPSLILLDLVMPEVDGFAVIEALRSNPRTAAVPVLVLSGRALSADDIRRLGTAQVIFQTKGLLSDPELAESLHRLLLRADALPQHTSTLIKRAIAFIHQHHAEPISRQVIADAVGMSKDYLGRIFLQEVGISPWEYLIRYRILRARQLLQTTDDTITEVAARVGFDSAAYFSNIFHREVGCSPRAFRAQHSR